MMMLSKKNNTTRRILMRLVFSLFVSFFFVEEEQYPQGEYPTQEDIDAMYQEEFLSDDDEIEFTGQKATLCCTNSVLMSGLYMVVAGALFQALGLFMYHFLEPWNYILFPTENNLLRVPLYFSWIINTICAVLSLLVFTKRPTRSFSVVSQLDSGEIRSITPDYENVFLCGASYISIFRLFSQISLFFNGIAMSICQLIFTLDFSYILLVPADRNAFLMFFGMGMLSFGTFFCNKQFLEMEKWYHLTAMSKQKEIATSPTHAASPPHLS